MISKKVIIFSFNYFTNPNIVYFLVKGVAGYVIPRFENTVYIQIEKGDHFGHIDLVYDPEILNI